MRYLICFVLMAALGSLTVTGAAQAQEEAEFTANREDIVRLLGQIPDYAPIREELMTLGFEGENLELAVSHAELVYRDPILAGHIADQVIAAFLDPDTAPMAGGLIWPLVERGKNALAKVVEFHKALSM
ncbi:MAG: hypothetical protein AAFO72_10785, partial [Pseudomonadota bacterium]